MKALILTIQFLTRIPIPINVNADEDDFAKGIVYFPIVGLIIGIINTLVYVVTYRISHGIMPIVFAVVSNAIITGAMHIDGLADTFDGIFSTRSRERVLEIMRDSRIGTNGTIAVICDFLLRISILQAMPNKYIVITILLSPVIAKTVVGITTYKAIYAREGQGMGKFYIEKLTPIRTLACGLIGLATFCLSLCFLKFKVCFFVPLFFSCILYGFLYRIWIYSKIGGMTGDTLGAANELIEIFWSFCVVLLWKFIL